MAKRRKAKKPRMDYTLLPTKIKTKVRILGLDPGKANMGISIVGTQGRSNKLVVVANSMMTHPLSELAHNFRGGIDAYLAEIDRWITMYKPHAIILERFMTRGTMGTTIEVVGIMIGAIATKYPKLPIKIISAATWKNDFRRKFTNETGVELSDYYKVAGVTPHTLDAILIGCYGLSQGKGKKVTYTPRSIIESAEATSCFDLIKRRLSIDELEG